MRKCVLCIGLLLMLAAAAAPAQETQDVIYLKNGSVVRGEIIERQTFPTLEVKIRTADGSEFVFTEDEIDRITQERVEQDEEREGTAAAQGDESRAAEDVPMDASAIELNLLGLAQFGPYVRYHIPLEEDLFVSPHVRVGYAGLIYYLLDWQPEIGVGVSFLRFWPSDIGANRFYAGAIVETQLIGNLPVSGVGLISNFGHRWRSTQSPRYWQLGLLAGAAYDFYWEEVTVLAMLEFAWGREFRE